MAKWGEGDPRWLVEERPDATNVNNWHWTEKNATIWSINKLTSLLVRTKIESDLVKCLITDVAKCEGEAVGNNRKGKIIFFYEWHIELEWTGTFKYSGESIQGRVEIPNLSEERNIKEVDIIVYLDNVSQNTDTIQNVMKSTGVEIIREKLWRYVTALHEEISVGLILPTKDGDLTSKCGDTSRLHFHGKGDRMEEQCVSKKIENTESKTETAEFQNTETFKCTAEEFYRAMTDEDLVKLMAQGPCSVDAKGTGKFELFDGNVTGRFVELVDNELIVQKWRFSTWPENHWSDVRLRIRQKDDCTEVTVTHKGIPKSELENTRSGWKRFYWDSMKRNLGFGAPLF